MDLLGFNYEFILLNSARAAGVHDDMGINRTSALSSTRRKQSEVILCDSDFENFVLAENGHKSTKRDTRAYGAGKLD